MIAPSRAHRKGRAAAGKRSAGASRRPLRRHPFAGTHSQRHGIVSRIIMTPHFCPPYAAVSRQKVGVRWPGPFGSGFLSPQPPGAVGIGPIHNISYKGQRKLVLLFFSAALLRLVRAGSRPASIEARADDVGLVGARGQSQSGRIRVISAARYTPRRASVRADRGCRPGHRRRRRRCLRERCCRVAPSSDPGRHSSRRSWSDFAPRCSK